MSKLALLAVLLFLGTSAVIAQPSNILGAEAATPRKLLENKQQVEEKVIKLPTTMAAFSKIAVSAGETCSLIGSNCKTGCYCLPISLGLGVCVGSCA